MNATDKRALLALTSLPTAAGREQQVIAWVKSWAKRRRWVTLREDKYGNIMLTPRGARSESPTVLAAHMDHPAFVVNSIEGHDVAADFRGGVKESYFVGSSVQHWNNGKRTGTGKITAYERIKHQRDPRVTVRCSSEAVAQVKPGDILTWNLRPSSIVGDRLHAPVCDNLVGVFAALQALAKWHARKNLRRGKAGDLRVLLTRAEEVGFVGAVGVCKERTLPKRSDIVVLEMSKSFADSPIGAGPVVRVGDASSTFDPALTLRLADTAKALAQREPEFRWQRRLMPGGTCEASAYMAYGYRAGCVCLPLGNYHNMSEKPDRVAHETISIADLEAMIRLLAELPVQTTGTASNRGTLKLKIDELFKNQCQILN